MRHGEDREQFLDDFWKVGVDLCGLKNPYELWLGASRENGHSKRILKFFPTEADREDPGREIYALSQDDSSFVVELPRFKSDPYYVKFSCLKPVERRAILGELLARGFQVYVSCAEGC